MRRSRLTLMLMFALLSFASTASAEWFLDGYVGASLTHKNEFTFEAFGAELERDAEYQSSAVFACAVAGGLTRCPGLGSLSTCRIFDRAPISRFSR